MRRAERKICTVLPPSAPAGGLETETTPDLEPATIARAWWHPGAGEADRAGELPPARQFRRADLSRPIRLSPS